MKPRFLVFAGPDYYPAGGWGDFRGAYLFLDDAKQTVGVLFRTYDWAHIVDLETMEQVTL